MTFLKGKVSFGHFYHVHCVLRKKWWLPCIVYTGKVALLVVLNVHLWHILPSSSEEYVLLWQCTFYFFFFSFCTLLTFVSDNHYSPPPSPTPPSSFPLPRLSSHSSPFPPFPLPILYKFFVYNSSKDPACFLQLTSNATIVIFC